MSHKYNARSLAVYVLQHSKKNVPLQFALDDALSKYPLEQNESALCTELVYGYTRYCLRIEFILDTLLKNRKGLPHVLQYTLGISTYSLLFLTRIPHYATVNWAVDFTKKNFGQGLAKLCNGVLRSLLRLEDAPLHVEFYKNIYDFYSVPSWLYDLWQNAYGHENTIKLLARSLQRPRTSFRLNKLHTNYAELDDFFSGHNFFEPIGFNGFVFRATNSPKDVTQVNFNDLHEQGAISWQSVGSQEILSQCFEAVPSLKEELWWDACAGQGGKTFALMEQGIRVGLASDISMQRLMQLKRTASRLKLSPPPLALMSAECAALNQWRGSILLDVPCSGLGTLAKRPDIRLNRSENDIRYMLKLQHDICKKTWTFLRKDSFLIYMTCTLSPSENDGQVSAFLKNNSDGKLLFSWQTAHDHSCCEGMYVAVIQKKST